MDNKLNLIYLIIKKQEKNYLYVFKPSVSLLDRFI